MSQQNHISHASHAGHAGHASYTNYASHASHTSHVSHVTCLEVPYKFLWLVGGGLESEFSDRLG